MAANAERNKLLEKLSLIEAVLARTASDGERNAAQSAFERLQGRLQELQAVEPPITFRFSLRNEFNRSLFIAVARRYDLRPFRCRGQRYTTVNITAPRAFIEEIFWPQYQQLCSVLEAELSRLTQEIIASSVHPDISEVEEVREIEAAGVVEGG